MMGRARAKGRAGGVISWPAYMETRISSNDAAGFLPRSVLFSLTLFTLKNFNRVFTRQTIKNVWQGGTQLLSASG